MSACVMSFFSDGRSVGRFARQAIALCGPSCGYLLNVLLMSFAFALVWSVTRLQVRASVRARVRVYVYRLRNRVYWRRRRRRRRRRVGTITEWEAMRRIVAPLDVMCVCVCVLMSTVVNLFSPRNSMLVRKPVNLMTTTAHWGAHC